MVLHRLLSSIRDYVEYPIKELGVDAKDVFRHSKELATRALPNGRRTTSTPPNRGCLTIGKELRVNLRLGGEPAQRFLRIKEHLGLKSDAEVLRYIINAYWLKHREELAKKKKKT